jgi:hypothetical protein
MPLSKTKATYLRRKKHLLRYDLDLLSKQVLIEIAIIIEDGQTSIITPITPLYEARFESFKRTVKRSFKPRELDCCFVAANNKEVHRIVYIPYLPGSVNHKAQTREYLNLEVVTLTYKGESHSSNYESFV